MKSTRFKNLTFPQRNKKIWKLNCSEAKSKTFFQKILQNEQTTQSP